jgi:hypothetical protein
MIRLSPCFFAGLGYAKANQVDRLQGLGFNVLQQLALYPYLDRRFSLARRLGIGKLELELVSTCQILRGFVRV